MSLRARLLLGTALIALMLSVAAVAIVRTTEQHLVDQVDDQLRGADARIGPGGLGPRAAEADGPQRLTTLYVGVIDADGVLTTVYAPNITADDAPVPQLDATDIKELREGEPVTVPSTTADVDYRMLARDTPVLRNTLVVALPLDGVQDTVNQLIAVELAAVIAVLSVLGLVMWWVIRLGVRPVQRMTNTASAIAGGDLSRRVPEATAGTEAGELSVALNGMLGRIEDAFDERTASEARLRRFVADASHELRTPVTTIRGYAELYRTGALDQPTELDEAMRRTEQEAIRMGSLVDDLLHLARLDQGRPLDREPVDLSRLAADAVQDALAVEPDRSITAVTLEPVMVLGDEPRLRQVMANLLTNALVHAPGAPIEIRVHRGADADAVVEIADEGPGMSDADTARAFERFYRADASRARHQGGSGLGLSIVDATVRAHGGTVSLTSAPGEGTTVRIELPLAGHSSGPRPQI